MSDESVKGHANSIKTGKKAASVYRMPKRIDENDLFIGCDIIVKKSLLCYKLKHFLADSMGFYGNLFLQDYFL